MRHELERKDPNVGGLSTFSVIDPLFRMRSEMDRMMSGFMNLVPDSQEGSIFGGRALIHAKMNLSEEDDKYLVEVELPGVKREEVEVSVDDGNLIIEGERKNRNETTDEEGGNGRRVHRVESSYGQFRRVMRLPRDVKDDSISAKFEDGILNITIGRDSKNGSRKQIPIDN